MNGRAPSEVKSKTGVEHSLAWKFGIQVYRVQLVILIRNVQNANARLGVAAQEAVADVGVELHEVFIFEVAEVATIFLSGPDGVALCEEATGQIVNSGECRLLQQP